MSDLHSHAKCRLLPVSRHHVDILLKLMCEFYGEDDYHFCRPKAKTALRELIRQPDLGRIWLVIKEATPIGYIILTRSFSMEFLGRDGIIDEFFIRKPYRGAGIGRKALKTVIGYARRSGLKALHLEVSTKKKNVQRFYRSLGFHIRDYYHLASKTLRQSAERRV